MDKAIIDMATRSYTDSIKTLLVDLLNDGNQEVRKAHDSLAGKKLLKNIIGAPPVPQKEVDALEATLETDPNTPVPSIQTATATASRPTRSRKAPARQADYLYGSDELSDDSVTTNEQDTDSYSDSDIDSQDCDSDSSSTFDPLSKDDVPGDDMDADENGELILRSKTYKQIRATYAKLSRENQELYDQYTIYLRQLLSLSADKVYTVEDLEDQEIHDRALRLLYRERFGQEHEYVRVGPHPHQV